MLFRGLPNILPLDNATDPADDQGAAGWGVLDGNLDGFGWVLSGLTVGFRLV